MINHSEIVIVGGGPIGLAHAWGFKKLNKDLKVVVLEKYEVYQRKHTLIMQHQQLKKLMKATGTQNDPALMNLLKQLKKDPHIRTNALEDVFKKLAIDSGVEITQEEVKEESIEQIITPFRTKLLIGADGTHSVVSRSLFPEGNQVKHEFDYVLQLRYEIKGDHKSEAINPIDFYQQMARQGLIANEYVGHYAQGKTPVTMQMMISKEDFHKLKEATSKNPILPFNKESLENLKIDEVPDYLKNFIFGYLAHKVKTCYKNGEQIDDQSLRISVNEAPATHARQVVNTHNDLPIFLAGDAGLGLSYFKGLNAGLESTAKFFSHMGPVIKKGLTDEKRMMNALMDYQTWFLKEFAPKKVKEVAQYSTWQIRSLMKTMKVMRAIKMSSIVEYDDISKPVLDDYFRLFNKDPLSNLGKKNWRLYPHRKYDPVKLGQFAYVPIRHSLIKIAKLFVDYFKPYKSKAQLVQDFKQPLVGVVNVGSGLLKIVVGLFTLNIHRFGDGIFSLARGSLELITWPLAWTLKPIIRGIATLIHGPAKIEENPGIKKLAQFGAECLDKVDPEEFNSNETTYKLLAVCNDLHRKFGKAVNKGQSSHIPEIEEFTRFNIVREDSKLTKETLRAYFSLFNKKLNTVEDEEQETLVISIK